MTFHVPKMMWFEFEWHLFRVTLFSCPEGVTVSGEDCFQLVWENRVLWQSGIVRICPLLINDHSYGSCKMYRSIRSHVALLSYTKVTIFDCHWTETNKKACTWLREFCSCSCLTALPGLAWVLLSKIYITFCSPLYLAEFQNTSFFQGFCTNSNE